MLIAAIASEAVVGTALTRVGLPDLMPLPWGQMMAIFLYAAVACLGINDTLKMAMMRWWLPANPLRAEDRRM